MMFRLFWVGVSRAEKKMIGLLRLMFKTDKTSLPSNSWPK